MDDPPSGSRTQAPRGMSPTGARSLVFDVASWHPKSVKRPRPVKSCSECRRRKLKCDRRCPCSQCQRSAYRVCTYGGVEAGSGDSSNRNSDPNNPNDANDSNDPNAESEGSECSEEDDSAPGSSAGERPLKRHLSRSDGESRSQELAGSGHPPANSSLSILLNPPSPSLHSSAPSTGGLVSSHASLPPSTATPSKSTPSLPHLPAHASLSALQQISTTLENPEHWMSLNGDELREYTSALSKEFMARMERLERLVLAKDASALTALTAIPPFPSSSTLSQLHLRYQPHYPPHQVIDASSTTMRSLSINGWRGSRTRYFGQSSTRVLLNLFDEAKDFMSDPYKKNSANDLFGKLERIHRALQEDHLQTLKPITVYVDSMMPVQKRMADIIPRRDVCDRLFFGYVNVSEGLYRVIHVPTFQQEFEAYWAHGVNTPHGVSEDFLPRLLCILCIGSRFETESKGLAYDRSEGVHIPTACALVRSWLDSVRSKPSVDVNVLQTEVLLLHASRMIASQSRRMWIELGMVSRLAMVMGLHRDPSEFAPDIAPFYAECRRKLWFTIMDMDLHVSLASSLPSALRPGEFTCQPPRNLDDADLYPSMTALPPAKPMDQYTEGQMQRFAADTLPLRMRASDLLCHIDSLTDYVEVLAVGGELEKALDDINCLFPRNAAIGSQHKYKEWRMRAVLDMHVRRPLLALYRPFALSASDECPPPTAISDIYLKSSMAMLTYMKELDATIPGFDDVNHMYYVVLRNDIVQAAFSVCYYIIQAVETEGLNTAEVVVPAGSRGSATKAPIPTLHNRGNVVKQGDGSLSTAVGDTYTGKNNGNGSINGDGPAANASHKRHTRKMPLIWTSAYMIRTVERTIENLARLVNDLSFDLRDVVALAIVLGSVMPAADQAQRNEHIRAQVERVLDTCVERLRGHHSQGIRAAVSGQDTYQSDWYNRSQPLDRPVDDEYNLWDKGFWAYWK